MISTNDGTVLKGELLIDDDIIVLKLRKGRMDFAGLIKEMPSLERMLRRLTHTSVVKIKSTAKNEPLKY